MFSRRKRGSAPFALLAIVAGILVVVPTAGAQSAADQYVPQLDKGGAASAPTPGAGSLPAAGAPEAPDQRAAKLAPREASGSGSGAGGQAPGDGTPLTPFVAALVALLAGGLLARLLLGAVRARAETA